MSTLIRNADYTLINAELVYDKNDASEFPLKLNLQYEARTKYKKSIISLNNVVLPITKSTLSINNVLCVRADDLPHVPYLCLYSERATVEGKIVEQVIEEYPEEMTIEEIEKELGHPIKIVKAKGND